MQKYNHKKIEKKWAKDWEEKEIYKTSEDPKKENFFILDMFPYPSGAGLHVGHPKGYIATDIFARAKRMKGFNVLHPMGWDAFGLPAENFAIKNKMHPAICTEKNIAIFKGQLGKLGLSYDWDREINTTDPKFYKWTQWAFIQMFNKGLAYESYEPINWCPSCKTGLANEDLENGRCERCDSEIEKKPMRQWVLKITDYAERMLQDLDKLPNWDKSIKEMQRNWIGKSEGALIKFPISHPDGRSPVRGDNFQFPINSQFLNNQKTNVVMIHGCPSDKEKAMDFEKRTYDKHWQPWIKKELEKRNIQVEFPLMPHPWQPTYEDHKREFEKLNINENSILIGHSCGTSFLLRWLGETKQKVKTLILVAPWQEPALDIERNTDFYTFSIDEDIKYRVENIIIFTADDEDKIGKESAKIFTQKLGATVISLENHGHYCESDMGTNEFPELLEEILRFSASSPHESVVNTESVEVFTTRPDTLFGATYMVLSPEHKLVEELKDQIENYDEVQNYIQEAKKKSEIDRTDLTKEKTGVEMKGIKAINPANKEEIPIFIADYVLAGYGTGAIMAVPAHDERDFEFAKKYDLPINYVISPHRIDKNNPPKEDKKTIERNNVHVLLVDPKNNKVVCLKSKKFPWTTFIIGGKKDGESDIETAKREVYEETGYKNIKFIKYLNSIPVIAEYYAEHKDCNNRATVNGIVFELEDNERDEITEEENAKHEIIWYSFDKKVLSKTINPCAELDIWMSGIESDDHIYSEEGILVNSGEFNGMASEEAKQKITEFVGGEMAINYKIQDWVFSRQRYWGEPIPIVHCEKCGAVPLPENQLPLELPNVKNYEPTGTGESPLAGIKEWVNTTCPKCGGAGKRETNTMPQWAGSSWYYLRFIDPKNDKELINKDKDKYWSPVDFYVGGAEHATRHLIYARFWHKFLFDIGVLNYDEPFDRLQHVGLILAEDGRKMSKRWGNVINPDEIVERFGADSMRVYEMFMGPFGQSCSWSTNGLVGAKRFLEKIWRISENLKDGFESDRGLVRELHKVIKKVGNDIEEFKLNTAVSAMMKLVNLIEEKGNIAKEDFEKFLKILAPFAPHITEELWENLGHKKSIHLEKWPKYDEALAKDETHIIAVQINGKVRAEIEIEDGLAEEEIKKLALANEKINKWIMGKEIPISSEQTDKIKKIIYIKNKLINIVI